MRKIQTQNLPTETIRDMAERYVYDGVMAASLWSESRKNVEEFWKIARKLQKGEAA